MFQQAYLRVSVTIRVKTLNYVYQNIEVSKHKGCHSLTKEVFPTMSLFVSVFLKYVEKKSSTYNNPLFPFVFFQILFPLIHLCNLLSGTVGLCQVPRGSNSSQVLFVALSLNSTTFLLSSLIASVQSFRIH